jgi:hypothetical protein
MTECTPGFATSPMAIASAPVAGRWPRSPPPRRETDTAQIAPAPPPVLARVGEERWQPPERSTDAGRST